MLSPTIAAGAATAITSGSEGRPSPASAPATIRLVSPGTKCARRLGADEPPEQGVTKGAGNTQDRGQHPSLARPSRTARQALVPACARVTVSPFLPVAREQGADL